MAVGAAESYPAVNGRWSCQKTTRAAATAKTAWPSGAVCQQNLAGTTQDWRRVAAEGMPHPILLHYWVKSETVRRFAPQPLLPSDDANVFGCQHINENLPKSIPRPSPAYCSARVDEHAAGANVVRAGHKGLRWKSSRRCKKVWSIGHLFVSAREAELDLSLRRAREHGAVRKATIHGSWPNPTGKHDRFRRHCMGPIHHAAVVRGTWPVRIPFRR
jgi:hypothetical protein